MDIATDGPAKTKAGKGKNGGKNGGKTGGKGGQGGQAARDAYYDRISKLDMAPLWVVLKDIIPDEPKTVCAPAIWRFKDVKPLVAEAEWSDRSEPKRLLAEIERKAANLPLAKGRKIVPALFVKKRPSRGSDSHLYGPRKVLDALP
mgnify:CR=1 FL=1